MKSDNQNSSENADSAESKDSIESNKDDMQVNFRWALSFAVVNLYILVIATISDGTLKDFPVLIIFTALAVKSVNDKTILQMLKVLPKYRACMIFWFGCNVLMAVCYSLSLVYYPVSALSSVIAFMAVWYITITTHDKVADSLFNGMDA